MHLISKALCYQEYLNASFNQRLFLIIIISVNTKGDTESLPSCTHLPSLFASYNRYGSLWLALLIGWDLASWAGEIYNRTIHLCTLLGWTVIRTSDQVLKYSDFFLMFFSHSLEVLPRKLESYICNQIERNIFPYFCLCWYTGAPPLSDCFLAVLLFQLL